MPCISCVVVMGAVCMPPRRVTLMVECTHAAAMVSGHHTAQRITLSFKAASRQRSHTPLGRAAGHRAPCMQRERACPSTGTHNRFKKQTCMKQHSPTHTSPPGPAEAIQSHPWPSASRQHYKMRSTSQAHVGVKPTTLPDCSSILRTSCDKTQIEN